MFEKGLFEGMRDVMQKKQSAPKPFAKFSSDFIPIKTSTDILSTPRRQKLLEETLPLISLSKENTPILCHKLLERFIAYVQELPQTRHHFYTHQGGLVDHALERTHIAMKLCRAYFLPTGSAHSPLTEPQTLWAYALFSASILHDIGHIIVDLSVKTYSSKTNEPELWLPFQGNLSSQGAFYRYSFQEDYPEAFRRYATLLLARDIMPEAGFRWISANRDVFLVWLSLLQDDTQNAGTLGAVLERAEAQSILLYLRELGMPLNIAANDQPTTVPVANNELGPLLDKSAESKEFQLREIAEKGVGVAFINWLRSEMASDKLKINEAGLFSVPGGFIMGADIFKLFAQHDPQNPLFQNAEAIKKALVKMGLLSKESMSFIHSKNHQTIKGLFFSQPEILLTGLSESRRETITAKGSDYLAGNNSVVKRDQYFAPNGQMVANPHEGPAAPTPSPRSPFGFY